MGVWVKIACEEDFMKSIAIVLFSSVRSLLWIYLMDCLPGLMNSVMNDLLSVCSKL